ncbi:MULTISPECIES: nuclear transport factor 2 family protein [Rhodococcus]|uniref:nuclear transport factor 2 family protein n=1 Tax=Rhodococcus TaxID=1827 RepID=UPI001F42FE50|nr:nuclear transport factor 2 family protein [Rhodococcus globerulus]
MTELVEVLTLNTSEQLLAIEEIKQVFAARLRVMDTKRWDLYPTFHTDDVVSETFGRRIHSEELESEAPAPVVGRDALRNAIERVLGGPTVITTAHHGHTPEITLTSDTTATGIWAMEDELWWTNGETEEHLHGYGHYHEKYRKVNGAWLISYRSLTRLREVHTPNFFVYMAASQ